MRIRALLILSFSLVIAACSSDEFVGTQDQVAANGATEVATSRSVEFSKFRHTQLTDRATSRRTDVAGKTDVPTVHLFIGFDEYEMNGVSRRVLDQYGVSRRVLDQYGITRRVLDQYGITRRILNEYGITRRVLDQYGDVIAEVPAIRGRAGYGRAVQGLSVEVEAEFLEQLLAALELDPDIGFVEPDPSMMTPVPTMLPDPQSESEVVPWGVERMGTLLTDFDGGDIHVVVMDSGVNESDDVSIDRERDISMLFQDRDREFWDDAEFSQVTPAFDPEDEGNPRDLAGHGSMMAETIGAEANGSGMRGVASGVRMHNLKVMSDDGRTDITTLTAAIDHITWFKTDLKPDLKLVINMSLGGDIETTTFNALDIAVQRAIDAGIVVIVAAGNDGRDASTYSPAHVEDAITVGAFDRSDEFAPYSNFGPFVDLLAPGSDIPAIDANGDFVAIDGTSAAAAHVTGAVAQYWALHPDATPLEIRDALVNFAQPVITGMPDGTTDRAVYIGEFAREWGDDEDFEIGSASYDASTGTLHVSGEGTRLEFVDLFRPYTGAHVGATVVDYNAEWTLALSGLDPVPCDIRGISAGVTFEKAVSNAPSGCEQTPQFLSATWKNGGVLLTATGTAGYDVSLTSTNTRTPLFAGTFDAEGRLFRQFNDFVEVPCSIELTTGPFTAAKAVVGAPMNCDGNVHINEAKWNRGALFLNVLGNPSAPIELTSTHTGIPLGSVVLDASGGSESNVGDLAEIPCSLTVTMGDKSATIAVDSAPLNCDSRPFVTAANWKGAYMELGGLANPNASVEIYSVGLNRAVGAGSADGSGNIDNDVYAFDAIPCEIKLRMVTPDGRITWSDSKAVSNAPLNCDGRDYLQLIRAEFDSGKKVFKAQGIGLSGTPGQPVEIRYPNGDRLAEVIPQSNGAFTLQISLDPTDSPCGFVDAGFVGATTIVDNFKMGKSSSTCSAARSE